MNSRKYQCFALRRQDGGVSIMRIYEAEDGSYSNVDEELKKWPEQMAKEVLSSAEIKEDDIPKDRSHRDRWVCDERGNISVRPPSEGAVQPIR